MSDFLYPIPKSVCLHMLRSESRSRGYSDPGVRISVLLDVDAGSQRSQREYADIWGWTYKRVRYHWSAIWEDVADWCSSYGRQMDSPMVERLPPESREYLRRKYGQNEGRIKGAGWGAARAQESAKTEPERDVGAQVGAQQGRSKGALTIHPFPTSLHPKEKENPPLASQETPPLQGVGSKKGDSSAKGVSPPKAKAKRFIPPTLEQAAEYFAELGMPEQAKRFHSYYESKGWTVGRGRGAPMKDWKAAARGWVERQRSDYGDDNANGKQKGGSTTRLQPASLELYNAKRRAASGGSRAA